ncbi:proline rich transmembrane protein 1B-like isoform X3 [Bombina bombina]|uniref:proline rich transmembrane protein 1B-like isoform X3 n=1 Tax=Bombina bombina TaxID=8345 RepID=UPI00235A9062|nr:proline rich transmembrane protein 1B-like isoform X3 [Bombina bombina]
MYPNPQPYNQNIDWSSPQMPQPGMPDYPPSYSNAQATARVYPSAIAPNVVMTTQPNTLVMVPQPTYKDYMGLSIMNLLLCCLPIGIAALIFSCKTRDAVSRGDQASAASDSRTAFTLNMVALGIGIAVNIVWIAVVIYVNTALYSSYSYYPYG